MGLNKSLIQGLLIAFVFTLPMFLGYAYFFNFNKEISIDKILIGVISAGFFEELYFRGFLFGQVFRNTKIGFIPSVLFGAILFALGHLYQSQELGQLVGIFATTFLGSILFAWVYCEWNYNLWVSIFLHSFMNLSWAIFAVSENAFGGTYANIFRIITIVFVILFTIIYKSKRGEKLIINKETIF
ncbi:MAG: CPBP family intramembrane metalloprotease [Flavobacteriaceae bacterium]|nr:CPBP family intramembrane metalloprotease [Flavobacteriaceae bacterium]